jgi:hypothetical protein
LLPLWDCSDTVVGVWEMPEGLEFIEFSIEADGFTPLARSEQGFWASCFNFLYECDEPVARLQEAATAVGFRFLDRLLATRQEAENRSDTFEGVNARLQQLVTAIDRESIHA